MEDIDKNIGGGHFRLIGKGIDRQKLIQGEEIEFGVEVEEEAALEEESQKYFDGETIFKTLNFDCCDDGEESDTSDKTPFQRMAEGMVDITQTNDGGILKKILKHGVGSTVPPGAELKVHYNAYLEYSEEPFDSTILRNYPERFKLGSGGHISGLEIAFSTMKKNEKSRFLINSNYAFGKMGCPPRIPADATVMFEIELKDFIDVAKADEFAAKSKEQRATMTFHDRLCLADSLRQKGNEQFNCKRYQQALRTYKNAVEQLENCRLANEEEEKAMEKKCVPLFLNASMAAIRCANWRTAAHFSRKALRLERKNVKALYRLGKALGQMGEFDDALRNLLEAQQLAPSNKEIRDELKNLNDNLKHFREMDKVISQKMFNPSGAVQPKTNSAKKDENEESDSMLDFLKNKIREFKEDEKQTVMYIPPSIKSDDLEQINKFAEEHGIVWEKEEDTGNNLLRK